MKKVCYVTKSSGYRGGGGGYGGDFYGGGYMDNYYYGYPDYYGWAGKQGGGKMGSSRGNARANPY